jgi:guanine deaminase
MDWLDQITFPNEAKCKEPEYATMLYTRMVRRMLRNGTTTALYFATIHLEASKILADICSRFGQRAYVGKLNIDQLAPDYYIETTKASLADTETFIQYCRAKYPGTSERTSTIHPVITPRFVPTCSYPLLQGLGDLAEKYDCHVQSHAAETVDEVTLVRSMYPDLERDVKIFQSVGLLRPSKTVFAHGVYLRNSEIDTLVENEIGVAVCPYSNNLYSRNVAPIQRFMNRGLRVGIGTDVAGGPSVSMLATVRCAVLAERTQDFTKIERDSEDWWPEDTKPQWDLDCVFGYYLATVFFPYLK